jgi:L-ribulose-5-phosphate 4-epimerase
MSDIEQDLRERLVKVGKLMWDEGLTGKKSLYLAGGNISARIPDTDTVLIKPSGYALGALKPEDLVIVDLQGQLVSGEAKPSSETPMHTTIYETRSDVGGIAHFHAHYCGVFGIAGIELLPLSYGGSCAALLKGVPIVPWVRPGTKELGAAIAEGLKNRCAVLMEFHGGITIGKTIEQAYHVASKVEELAEFQWRVMAIGKPNYLPEEMRNTMFEWARKREFLV